MPTVPTTRRRRGRGTHRSDSGPTPGVRSRQLTRRRTINSARAPRNSVRFTPSSDIHRSGVQRKFTPSPDLHHPQIYTIPNLHHPRCTYMYAVARLTPSTDWHVQRLPPNSNFNLSPDLHRFHIYTVPHFYTVLRFTSSFRFAPNLWFAPFTGLSLTEFADHPRFTSFQIYTPIVFALPRFTPNLYPEIILQAIFGVSDS